MFKVKENARMNGRGSKKKEIKRLKEKEDKEKNEMEMVNKMEKGTDGKQDGKVMGKRGARKE